MPPMHETMVRLYEAARQLRGVEGQSAIARLINQSPQTVKNWESRGMSYAGMIEAEKTIGCAARWLESGMPPMAIGGKAHSLLSVTPPVVDTQPAATLARETLAFAQDYELACKAKREILKRMADLPEHEIAALLPVVKSISEKYEPDPH